MSLDAIYADSIDAGIKRWAANPGPEPEPSFSVPAFLGAGGKGVPSAALERGGFFADILSGFGTAAAASGGSAGGMFSLPTPAEQKQEADARQKMLEGNSFDPAAGNVLRRKAEEFAPDPLTSHAADQVVHGLVRFGAKAVTDIGLMGPAGALLTGVEEGNTVTQNLREKGIDTATAAKVGAVQGGFATVGAVMPLGGRTIMQTLGLVAVGGPGSFVAQEALSRQILEKAGHYDEASLHNPFDPLGLTLSAVIPGAFGAFHARGQYRRAQDVTAGRTPLPQLRPDELRALKYDDPRLDAYASTAAEKYGVPPALLLAVKNAGEKSGPTAVSGKGATGVMQFMEGTAKEMGLADRTDPVASIDAGARYLKKLYDAYGSWDAAVAHYNGGGAQAAMVRSGGAPTAKETIGYLSRVREYVANHTAEAAAKDPANVDAARVTVLNDTVARSLPDTPDAHAQVMRAADVVGESGGRAAEAEIAPVREAFPELPRLTGTDLVGRSFEELDDMHGRALEHNRAVDMEAIRKFWGDEKAKEAEGWSTRQRENWLSKEETDEASSWMQARYINDELISEHRAAANDFDTDSPEALGRSVAVRARKVDEPGFFETPAGHSFTAAMRYAKEQGWDMDKVLSGMRSRSAEWAGADAPELFKRMFHQATERRAGIGAAREADNALPPPDSVKLAGDEPAKRGAEVGGGQNAVSGSGGDSKSASAKGKASGEAGGGESGAPRETSPAATLDQQIAQKLATEQPDLRVTLPGSDEQITVAEAMKRIAEIQKTDGQWADLVRTAAECALGA